MRASVATRTFHFAWCSILLALPTSQCHCQTIVLRNLQLLENAQLQSMSIEGITLVDGQTWSWDQIQEGQVSPDLQVEFDRWRTEMGEPLFRVRLRLSNRDYSSLQPHADDLAVRAGQIDSNSTVYYLACCAQIRFFLDQKRRESALEPLLDVLRMRNAGDRYKEIDELSSLHFSDDGLCDELLPIWFDAEAAGQQWEQIKQSDTELKTSSDGVAQIYLNTLAIAAGELTIPFDTTPRDDRWRSLYAAQSAWLAGNTEQVANKLDVSHFGDNAGQHAIALYYLGTAQLRQQTQQDEPPKHRAANAHGQLTLLKIPALYEDRFAELSAAAISAVVEHSDTTDQAGLDNLRRELAGRYRHTTFGTPRQ